MKSKILIPIFVLFFLATAVNAFVISGTVTDTGTSPINGALVEILDTGGAVFNSTTTNTTGDYSVEAGGPILRTVRASATGYDPQSTPIFVNSNKTINFALGPIQAVSLYGYVTDGTSPLNNVDVQVKQGGATFTETNTNAAGFYNVSVVDGDSYDVTASLTGYDSNSSPVTISGATELNLTLTQTPTSCTENWTCTAWSTCSGGTQTRTCTDQNNCGTEINKPAESRSCSTSSSGSSGGYDGQTYRVQLSYTDEVTERMRRRDVIKFNFNGVEHKVEVTRVLTTSVSLLIESEPIVASLDRGQTGKYDLDGDEFYDLKITAKDISYSRATLGFLFIDESIHPAPVITTLPPLTTTYTPPPKPPKPKEIIIEDVPAESEEDESTPTMFASAIDFVKKVPNGVFNFVKSIPYLSYAAAGIVILLIIIVAMKLFKSEEIIEEDFGNYSKEKLRKKIGKLEKQISRLRKANQV